MLTDNGNVFLDPANSGFQNNTFDGYGVGGFLGGQPQLTPFWMDLDPSAATGGGSMHFDVDVTAAVPVAYATWMGVDEFYYGTSPNTFQVALFADGRVEFRYGACSVARATTLVGFTSGYSSHDPGATDISAAVPFSMGDGTVPPALGMDARPILGTSPNLIVADVPNDTLGVVLLGLPLHGIDLRFAGMPGCVQRVLPLSIRPFQATGTTASIGLSIPGFRFLVGTELHAQSLVLSPGSNAAGRTISNALCIRLGR